MSYVVFVPGIMGSELKLNEAKKWPVIMAKDVREISLEVTPEILNAQPLLKYGVNTFYERINEYLVAKYSDSNVLFFAYDWRQDLLLEDTFLRLNANLENKQEITFVAHSMGGLLTRLFVDWCEKNSPKVWSNIANVITLATPWRGSPEALWGLYYGNPHPKPWLPLTSPQVMKEVSSTFPSVYQLLPRTHMLSDNDLMYDPNKGKYLFFSDIVDKHFNVKQRELFRKHTTNFDKKVSAPWPAHIKSYAMIGQRYATPASIHLPKGELGRMHYEKQTIHMSAGDMTVPIQYAFPYDDQTEVHYIKATHVNIAKSEKVLNWVSNVISKLANVEVFEEATRDFSGEVIKIACPVKVAIYKDDNEFIAGEAKDLATLKQQIDYILELEAEEYESEDGTLLDELRVFGETTLVISSERRDLNYKIEGKEDGLASIEVVSYDEGKAKNISIFPSIQVEKGKISTLHLNKKEGISLDINHISTKPVTFTPKETKKAIAPITEVSYEMQNGDVPAMEEELVIQTPIKLKFSITGISDVDYLETRIIVNGHKFVSTTKEHIVKPFQGENEVTVYSVSRYGVIEDKPKTYKFIYDTEPPYTLFNVSLAEGYVRVILKAVDASKDNLITRYRLSQEEDFQEYPSEGIKVAYDNQTLEFYSTDGMGNKEEVNKLVLPGLVAKIKIFSPVRKSYQELMKILELDEEGVTVESNGKVTDPNKMIRKDTRNVVLTSEKGNSYSFMFAQEVEVLWRKYPEEILKAEDKSLNEFVFQLVGENGFLIIENVKVRLAPKGRKTVNIPIEVKPDKERLEYKGVFGTPKIPRAVEEGRLQVWVNGKLQREAHFKIM